MKKKGIWPVKELNLSYFKPKFFNCQIAKKCKIYIKEHKYDICKFFRQCSFTTCSKIRKCDMGMHGKKICQYVSKKYYAICSIKKRKCEDYKDLPSKYIINSNKFSIKW